MKKGDFEIIAQLRKNARKNLTKVSRDTGIPVSTIFDKIKKFEKDFIKKHTSIIDFKKLGFNVRVFMIIRASKERKEDLKKFLTTHEKVNSVFKVNSGYDFMADAVFKDMAELCKFSDEIDQFDLIDKKEHFILDEIKEEEFLGEVYNAG